MIFRATSSYKPPVKFGFPICSRTEGDWEGNKKIIMVTIQWAWSSQPLVNQGPFRVRGGIVVIRSVSIERIPEFLPHDDKHCPTIHGLNSLELCRYLCPGLWCFPGPWDCLTNAAGYKLKFNGKTLKDDETLRQHKVQIDSDKTDVGWLRALTLDMDSSKKVLCGLERLESSTRFHWCHFLKIKFVGSTTSATHQAAVVDQKVSHHQIGAWQSPPCKSMFQPLGRDRCPHSPNGQIPTFCSWPHHDSWVNSRILLREIP